MVIVTFQSKVRNRGVWWVVKDDCVTVVFAIMLKEKCIIVCCVFKEN